jgi:WD40 repeat protein
MDFSPDGRLFGLVTDAGFAEIWATERWSILDASQTLAKGSQIVRLDDGGALTAFFADGTAQVWQAGHTEIRTLSLAAPVVGYRSSAIQRGLNSQPDPWLSSFRLTSDDRLLIPGNPARVFDLRSGTLSSLSDTGPVLDSIDGYDTSNPDVIALWGWTTGYLADAKTLQPVAATHWATSRTMAITSDGKTLALKRGATVVLVDRASGREMAFDAGWKFEHLRFSADGKTVVTWDKDTSVRAYSVDTGAELWLPRLYGERDGLSADLHYAVQVRTGGLGNALRMIDVSLRRALYELPLDATTTSFSRDGRHVAVALRSGSIVVVDVASGRREAVLSGFSTGMITNMQFTADAHRLLASDGELFLAGWDLSTQRKLFTLTEQNGEWTVSTPSGLYDGSDGELRHYYWVEGTHTYPLEAKASKHHVPGLMAALWRGAAPVADILEASAEFGLPDLPVLQLIGEVGHPSVGHPEWRFDVRVDGETIGLTATRNGVPQEVTRRGDGTFEVKIMPVAGPNRILMWSEDRWGRQSAQVELDRYFDLHIAPQPEIVTELKSSEIHGAAFSADGSLMAIAAGHAITLWDMRTRRQLRMILNLAHWATQVEFVPSGEQLVAATREEGIRIFDTRTGIETCRVEPLDRSSSDREFSVSPEGTTIAITDGGIELTRLFKIPGCIQETSFDSRSLAPVWMSEKQLLIQTREHPRDELTRLDMDTLQEIHLKTAGPVRSFSALPDGRALVVLEDGRLQIETSAGAFQALSLDPTLGQKFQRAVVLRSGRLLVDAGKTQVLLAKTCTPSSSPGKGATSARRL